jgi:HPt (histidine-containing phosphotransfer) domain-containing protein
VLDLEVVEELRSIMGIEHHGLVKMFFEDAPAHISKLQAALAANDIAAMVAPSHTLKSASANLGAMALSSVAKRIEHGARAGNLEKPAHANNMQDHEYRNLVKLFLEDAPTHIEKLRVAAEAGDIAGMVAPAHTLKSSSANLGALALSSVAKRIEFGARTEALTKPALAVNMLENEFRRARAALSAL